MARGELASGCSREGVAAAGEKGRVQIRAAGLIHQVLQPRPPAPAVVRPRRGGAVVHLLAATQVEKFAPAQAANLVMPGYRLGV